VLVTIDVRRMTRCLGLAVGLVAVAVVLAYPATSHATLNACLMKNKTVIRHPRDPAYACVWSHSWVTVCDPQRDGHRARFSWVGQFPPPDVFFGPWAREGGCATMGTAYGSPRIWKISLCVEREGCSPVRQWP
jgi:hypothetical protein